MAWHGKERNDAIENATQAAGAEIETKLGRPLTQRELYALNDAITEFLMSQAL